MQWDEKVKTMLANQEDAQTHPPTSETYLEWKCSQGHTWYDTPKMAQHRHRYPRKWQKLPANNSCPVCTWEKYGPRLACCATPIPTNAGIFYALASVRNPPEKVTGKPCSKCGPIKAECGSPTYKPGTRKCSTCHTCDPILELYPWRKRQIEQLGLKPHEPILAPLEQTCPTHQETYPVSYWLAATKGLCQSCDHQGFLDHFKVKPGQLIPGPILYTSEAEQAVKKYLTKHFTVYEDTAIVGRKKFRTFSYICPDIILPEQKIAVEVDGYMHHKTHGWKDCEKDQAVRRAGWKVIRLRLGKLPALESANANIVTPSPSKAALAQLRETITELGQGSGRVVFKNVAAYQQPDLDVPAPNPHQAKRAWR